jgi:hypothetical protein
VTGVGDEDSRNEFVGRLSGDDDGYSISTGAEAGADRDADLPRTR